MARKYLLSVAFVWHVYVRHSLETKVSSLFCTRVTILRMIMKDRCDSLLCCMITWASFAHAVKASDIPFVIL